MALTDTKIKQLEAISKISRAQAFLRQLLKPAEKNYKVPDEKGMFFLVKTSGSKLWQLKYRFGGKENIFSIGTYPEVRLKDARERRDKARSQLANGINPNELKKAAKIAQSDLNSFSTIAMEWYWKQEPAWASATAKKRLALLQNDLMPWLGRKDISELTAKDLLAGLQRIENRGAKDTAHNARQVLGQIS